MHSEEEPNCFFGGMAIPQWETHYNFEHVSDPVD